MRRFRHRLTAAATAVATSAALSVAPATAQVDTSLITTQARTQDKSSEDASSDYDMAGSSYNKWLDEKVATTDNESTNTFLKLLVDFLIGIAAFLVIGGIYGEIVRQM